MALLNTILNGVLSIVFPAQCLSCGKYGKEFCASCLSEAPAAERETADWIFPAYDYRHPPIKKALWHMKYDGKKRLVGAFAEILHEKIMEELSELAVMQNFRDPILIPVPLSRKRYFERGYNQAELICRELIKINDIRHGVYMKLEKNILIKSKETEHQARIKDRSKRLKNLLDSFSVQNADLVKKRNIILIDDVTTTGATLNEARKTLKKAGARKVIAFTIAH